jgi:hypothetical protein
MKGTMGTRWQGAIALKMEVFFGICGSLGNPYRPSIVAQHV